MSEKKTFRKNAFFLFLLDSICDLMGCSMAKGILQRIGENISDKLILKFSEESLNVKSMEELKNSNNPLTFFDDTLIADGKSILILEKCPFLELLTSYKEINNDLPSNFGLVTEIYNEEGLGYAVSPFCIIHQTFRKEIAKFIKIDGKECELLHLACKATSGAIKFAHENMKNVNMSEDSIKSLLENKACTYLIQVKE